MLRLGSMQENQQHDDLIEKFSEKIIPGMTHLLWYFMTIKSVWVIGMSQWWFYILFLSTFIQYARFWCGKFWRHFGKFKRWWVTPWPGWSGLTLINLGWPWLTLIDLQVIRDLLSRVTISQIGQVVKPLLTHLDTNKLWSDETSGMIHYSSWFSGDSSWLIFSYLDETVHEFSPGKLFANNCQTSIR